MPDNPERSPKPNVRWSPPHERAGYLVRRAAELEVSADPAASDPDQPTEPEPMEVIDLVEEPAAPNMPEQG